MGGRNILVADDDTVASELLRYVLKSAGFAVTIAANGRKALEVAHVIRFDLIITDHQMPHLSGGELCTMLRKSEGYADTPMILITAKCMEMDVLQLQNDCNLFAVFQKPFSPRKVIAAAGRCLSLHELSSAT